MTNLLYGAKPSSVILPKPVDAKVSLVIDNPDSVFVLHSVRDIMLGKSGKWYVTHKNSKQTREEYLYVVAYANMHPLVAETGGDYHHLCETHKKHTVQAQKQLLASLFAVVVDLDETQSQERINVYSAIADLSEGLSYFYAH